ncbi:hypothetical protein GTA08_BOTSDO00135 [Neofusicoccum parvum]|uniref:Uncharacterized protein n=1 Tax=Neofusicoccum parvum TaxID=310453 RepID=A0ACB5SME8_9PEZI|nr:hypothetical protein GTA08_BOTSDO00135 [Neofusicoccum parvum]
MKFYPHALENRYDRHDPAVHGARHAFLRAALINFVQLQLLFLGIFSYIFGAIFQQSSHAHNIHVLYVDYDHGTVGQAVRNASQSLQGRGFPTVVEHSQADYPTPNDLRHAVCKKSYWAALFTSAGASARLEAATSGLADASLYNKSDELTFIWNEAHYPTIADTVIAGSMKTISDAARLAYSATNGSDVVQSLAASSALSPAAMSAFADPWHLTSDNIQPTTQSSRLIYNTIVILLLLIQEFFYLGTINGLYVQFRIFSRIHPLRIALVRLALSLAYTLVGSLCTAGVVWAFRAGWAVSGAQFALTWAALWLFAHANFLTLDIFALWLAPAYVPMALIAWAMLNVASILVPLELAPAFYRWSYALPAHEVFQVLVDVWPRGCNPQLRHALPVLFAYEVVGLASSVWGAWRRCHYAVIAEEAQEKSLMTKVEERLAVERQVCVGEKGVTPSRNQVGEELRTESDKSGAAKEDGAPLPEQEADVMAREEQREIRRMRTMERRASMGPSFQLAFGNLESGGRTPQKRGT